MCIAACEHVHVWGQVHMHVEASCRCQVSSSIPPHLISQAGSFCVTQSLVIQLVQRASLQWGSHLYLPSAGIIGVPPAHSMYVDPGGLDSGPYVVWQTLYPLSHIPSPLFYHFLLLLLLFIFGFLRQSLAV